MTDAMSKPPKKYLDALGRVFDAEINDRLPFQSKAQVYRDLMGSGLLTWMRRKFGTGWTAVTIEGYALTERGRMLYCKNCEAPTDV